MFNDNVLVIWIKLNMCLDCKRTQKWESGGYVQIWTFQKPLCPFWIIGHYDKPTIVRYHPTASNVLASASADLTIKIWDICTQECVITLQGHKEQVGFYSVVFIYNLIILLKRFLIFFFLVPSLQLFSLLFSSITTEATDTNQKPNREYSYFKELPSVNSYEAP